MSYSGQQVANPAAAGMPLVKTNIMWPKDVGPSIDWQVSGKIIALILQM